MEMKKVLSYEAVVSKGDDGYTVVFPQFPGAFTEGNTRKEALDNAHDALIMAIVDRYECCDMLPPEDHVVEVATISVEMTSSIAEEQQYMTMQDAAEFLDVGLSRVSQLVKQGRLESIHMKGIRLVSIASVDEYRKSPRKAGRPKKYDKRCKTCEYEMDGVCGSHGEEEMDGHDLYGMKTTELSKVFPMGCADWSPSFDTFCSRVDDE